MSSLVTTVRLDIFYNGEVASLHCLPLSNLHIDTSTVFQTEAIGRFVSGETLSVEAKLEAILVQSLAFGKDGKDNTKGASVS